MLAEIAPQCSMYKRLFDIASLVFSLPLWLPLMAFVALLVRIKLGSPIFFRQPRPGKGDVVFELIKFRTMKNLRDENGRFLPDAARMSDFGRWLRASSLDELPEVINVLRGEMSLVGPRPLLVDYLPLYSVTQRRRHFVRPGITGWAQINGRNCISWEDRFKLDVWYVENWSFWLDLRILWLTVGKVVRRSDISAAGSVTMTEFTGSGHGSES